MKRRDTLLLIVLLSAAVAAAVYFYRDNRNLRRQVAELRDLLNATPAVAARPSGPDVAPGEGENSDEPPPPPDAARDGRGRGDRRGRMAEVMAKMMTDPDAQQAMLLRIKERIDRMYGPLFQRLGLDDVQAETLRTLLAEQEMARAQFRMLERNATTDEEKAQIRAQMEERLASIGTGIETVLGSEGQQLLSDYQRTYSERQSVEDVSRRATYAGVPLSTEASDQLAQIMTTVKEDNPVDYPGGRSGPPGSGETTALTADSVSSYLAAKLAQDQEILRQAQSVLTSEQLEALADKQLEEYEQLQAQLNFQLNNPDVPTGGPMGFGGGGGPRGGGGPGGPPPGG